MLKSDYRGIKKLNRGPGGWKCPCCNPFDRHPRNMKHKAHRLARHVRKNDLRVLKSHLKAVEVV